MRVDPYDSRRVYRFNCLIRSLSTPALTTRLLIIDQFIRRESALEGRVRDLHAELESVRREVTVATRERDFAREESARTREAMDELEMAPVSVILLSLYMGD